MTALILIMMMQNNGNGPLLDGFVARRNRPAVVRPADRPIFQRLARPFRRGR